MMLQSTYVTDVGCFKPTACKLALGNYQATPDQQWTKATPRKKTLCKVKKIGYRTLTAS